MQKPVELTNGQARRFILRRLGLVGEYQYHGRGGAADYIRHVNAVQVDPIEVCGRSHENTLHSRVQGFKKPMLDTLLYRERQLFEYHDKCLCILPVEQWPAFASERARYEGFAGHKPEVVLACQTIRGRLAAKGPLTPAQLEIEGHVADWPAWDNKGVPLVHAALDALYYTGEVMIAGRQSNQRLYHLAAHSLPGGLVDAPCPFEGDRQRYFAWQVKRRIAACGLLGDGPSDAWVNLKGFTAGPRREAFAALLQAGELVPVQVEGLPQALYCLAADAPLLAEVQAGKKWRSRCELIAPLDSFIWDRKLIGQLFGLRYTWEIYTPEKKRKYGYYVMPVLCGEALPGRIEVVKNKKGGPLLVKNFWPEKGVRRSKRLDTALANCLARFARFHGCDGVQGLEDAWR